MFTIAKTDPATSDHKALTFFLVPMESAGLSRRPIQQLDSMAAVAFEHPLHASGSHPS
jgi:alkylation response protein AidB-like acyl-CoA dehydrogenase